MTPRTAVTGTDDPTFTKFVDSVIQPLFAAYLRNITNDTAERMSKPSVFGNAYEDMLRNADNRGSRKLCRNA